MNMNLTCHSFSIAFLHDVYVPRRQGHHSLWQHSAGQHVMLGLRLSPGGTSWIDPTQGHHGHFRAGQELSTCWWGMRYSSLHSYIMYMYQADKAIIAFDSIAQGNMLCWAYDRVQEEHPEWTLPPRPFQGWPRTIYLLMNDSEWGEYRQGHFRAGQGLSTSWWAMRYEVSTLFIIVHNRQSE